MKTHNFSPLVIASFAMAITLLVSCSSCFHREEDGAGEAVDSFATAYFNWQFGKAVRYVDAGSERWLSYAASQVMQEDVDSLRAMAEGANVDVKDVAYGDSLAMATVEVGNFLAFDSIGKAPRVVDRATYKLPVKQVGGRWKVVLDGLPRQLLP